jgi:hypothetical protein
LISVLIGVLIGVLISVLIGVLIGVLIDVFHQIFSAGVSGSVSGSVVSFFFLLWEILFFSFYFMKKTYFNGVLFTNTGGRHTEQFHRILLPPC